MLLWVAGFDLIYATQDHDFDRQAGLHSLVVRLGIARSLRARAGAALGMLAVLAVFGIAAGAAGRYFASLALIAGALIYEHRARPGSTSPGSTAPSSGATRSSA